MAWVTECPKCGKHRVYNHDAGTCYVCTPAPKEKEMEPAIPHRRCQCCQCYLSQHEHEVCDDCLERKATTRTERAATLRAVYERAYFAALGGSSTDIDLSASEHVRFAHADALETVRQWPAMMAELEQEIAK